MRIRPDVSPRHPCGALGARRRGAPHAAGVAILDTPATRVCVSVVCAWEMRIKSALGKLTMPDDLPAQLIAARFEPLPITLAHALAAGALPPHHRDPFDRMLVAQAQLEGLTLVTHDARMRPYDVTMLWA